MNKNSIVAGQPEQELTNEQTAQDKQVSPSIANALVGGSTGNEIFKNKLEWQESEFAKAYEKMKAKFDRLDELEKNVGELPEGAHPDERKPRAETWLQERANWQSEVEMLRNKIKEQELIIHGIEEGSESWKAEYDNCRAILVELVALKKNKDRYGKTEEYLTRQPLVWESAKDFLKTYQHEVR